MDARQVWQAALGELQLQMTKATFDTWLKDTSVISYEDSTVVIGVSNAYAKEVPGRYGEYSFNLAVMPVKSKPWHPAISMSAVILSGVHFI